MLYYEQKLFVLRDLLDYWDSHGGSNIDREQLVDEIIKNNYDIDKALSKYEISIDIKKVD